MRFTLSDEPMRCPFPMKYLFSTCRLTLIPGGWSTTRKLLQKLRLVPINAETGQVPKNNSFWASRSANFEHAESIICGPGRSGVSGQPRVQWIYGTSINFLERDLIGLHLAPSRFRYNPKTPGPE